VLLEEKEEKLHSIFEEEESERRTISEKYIR
jgi:hypothetical protein